MIRNTIRIYGEELLAPRPTPKTEDHPLSAVRDCLFNIFAATLHIGDGSSIRNLGTRHAVATGTQLNSTQLNSTQLNSTQLNSTQLNSLHTENIKEKIRCQGSKTLSAIDIWPTTS